jgi:outer membrane protein
MIAALLAVIVPVFAQLTLDGAQSQALAHSPDVAIARAKVDEAQALFDQARGSYAPALTANYTEGPQGIATGQVAAQRLTTVGAQIALGDLLAASPEIAQANAVLRGAQFDLDDAERTERIAVIARYFDVLVARAIADARSAVLQDAQAQDRAAQLRYQSGDAPRLDVVRAEVDVANAQADLALATAGAQNAADALGQETALDDSDMLTQMRDEPIPALVPYDVAGAIRIALATRPEIASAQTDVVAEERAVEVARRGRFPALTLAGGYTSGIDSAVKVNAPSASLAMSVPLGGAPHDRVVAEQARLAQARAQLLKVRREITIEVGAAVRTQMAQGAALAASDRALHAANAEYEAAQIGYRSGASSGLEVEAARSTYVGALVAQLEAYYAQAEAQATLQLLMGSGHA